MGGKKALVERIREFKSRVSKKIPIQSMIWFGSRASGTAKKYSDVDLVVVSKEFEGKDFFERPFILYKEWDLDYPVDFLCYTPKEFNKKSKQVTIIRASLKEGITI